MVEAHAALDYQYNIALFKIWYDEVLTAEHGCYPKLVLEMQSPYILR